MRKRVLYLQYTNPAGYPPLQHSSLLFANAGWEILFLGTGAHGAKALELAAHPRIKVRKLGFCRAGWRQKLHYLYFCLWTIGWALRWRPSLVYASDPMACPSALALERLGFKVLYHEHDSPTSDSKPRSAFARLIASSRQMLARQADFCVLPNGGRAEHFRLSTGRKAPVHVVWNCPSTEEAVLESSRNGIRELKLYYHGNLSPRLLPLAVIDAMARTPHCVRLTAIGYKTLGNEGYDDVLLSHAAKLGMKDRVTILPPMSRPELLQRARQFDVGWAALPSDSSDINFRHMVGASNKAFDYLACGLALLVSDDLEWKSTFADRGYGLACDLNDSGSIARALAWFCEHPSDTREMGERGRKRVMDGWNYQNQFMPIMRNFEATLFRH